MQLHVYEPGLALWHLYKWLVYCWVVIVHFCVAYASIR